MKIQICRKRLSRSTGGDIVILMMLAAGAAFSALPLVFVLSSAFKPMNELFLFPPQFLVRNPTLKNFSDLLILMGKSWVPISRYLLNSVIIVLLGLAGNIIFGSLAAYVLSKHRFPGKKLVNDMILLSLMFAAPVVAIPNYLTLSYLGFINTYWGVIVPTWGSTLGLYLMRNFMDTMIPDTYLEAARLDGATELQIFWKVAMPLVKPAWLTMLILAFQHLWGVTGDNVLYAEQLKPLPYALRQIAAGGIGRAGVTYAVALVMMTVPIVVFVVNQTKVVQTMATSGID